MANVNFKYGNLKNLSDQNSAEGYLYFAINDTYTDNNKKPYIGKIYFDAPNGQRILMGEGFPIDANTGMYAINVSRANSAVNDSFGNSIHKRYIHDIKPASSDSNNKGKLLITKYNDEGEEITEAIDLSTVDAGGTTEFTTIHKLFVTSVENQKEFSDSTLDFSDHMSVGVYVSGYKIPHSEVSFNGNTMILANPPELIGTEVEVIITKAVKVDSEVSVLDLKNKMDFYKQSTAPTNVDAIWIDTSSTPYVLRFHNGVE